MNVFGVPSVGPSTVLGSEIATTSAPTLDAAAKALASESAAPK
jgi:hypothetical protein